MCQIDVQIVLSQFLTFDTNLNIITFKLKKILYISDDQIKGRYFFLLLNNFIPLITIWWWAISITNSLAIKIPTVFI